ncbi:MAG: hypothetical protein HYV59_08820 [Planctomycetes bacterium]|nr:hypothetical protein [Planctomycetota bacterium]
MKICYKTNWIKENIRVLIGISSLIFPAVATTFDFYLQEKVTVSRSYGDALVPTPNIEWGSLEITSHVRLDELRLSARDSYNPVVVDMSINGKQQGFILAIPEGATSGKLAGLAKDLKPGDVISFKFTNAIEPGGFGYVVDITWHSKDINIWILIGILFSTPYGLYELLRRIYKRRGKI